MHPLPASFTPTVAIIINTRNKSVLDNIFFSFFRHNNLIIELSGLLVQSLNSRTFQPFFSLEYSLFHGTKIVYINKIKKKFHNFSAIIVNYSALSLKHIMYNPAGILYLCCQISIYVVNIRFYLGSTSGII